MKGFQHVTLPRFFFSFTLLIFSLANTALANPNAASSPTVGTTGPVVGQAGQALRAGVNDVANSTNMPVAGPGVVGPTAPTNAAPAYQAPAANTYAAPTYSAPSATTANQPGTVSRVPPQEVNTDYSQVVRAPVTSSPAAASPTTAAAPTVSVDPIVSSQGVTRPVAPIATPFPVSAAAATEILRAAAPGANLEPVVTDLANGGYSFQVQAGENSHALQAKDTNTGDTITLVGEGTPANSDVSVTYGEITTTASVSGPVMCWRVRRGESSCGHGPFPPSKVVYKSARSVEIWEVCSDKSEKLLGSRIEGCISGQGFEFCPADGGPCRPAVPVTEPYPKDSPPDGLGVPTAGEAETPGAETPGTGGVTPPAKAPETGKAPAPTEGPTAPTSSNPNPNGSNPSSPPAGTPAGNPPAANPPASGSDPRLPPGFVPPPKVCKDGSCGKDSDSAGGHETDPVGSDDGAGTTPGSSLGDPSAPAGSASSPGSTDGTKGRGKPAPDKGPDPVNGPKTPPSSSGTSAGTPSGGTKPPGGAPTGGGVGTGPGTPSTSSSPAAGGTSGGGPIGGPTPKPENPSPVVMCPNGYTVIYTRNDCSACKRLKFKNGQGGEFSDAWIRYMNDPCVVIRDYDHISETRPAAEKAFADSIESGLPEFIHATPEQARSMGMTDSSGRGTKFGK